MTYTPAAGYSRSDDFTFRANDGTVNSNTATVSITVVPPSPTSLTVNASSGDYADATVVSAVLRNRTTAAPVQGEPVQLILNGKEACRGTTDSTGTASCSLTPLEAVGPYALSGSFAGDTGRSPALLASSGSNTFTVTPEEAALAYTGPDLGSQRPAVHACGATDNRRPRAQPGSRRQIGAAHPRRRSDGAVLLGDNERDRWSLMPDRLRLADAWARAHRCELRAGTATPDLRPQRRA